MAKDEKISIYLPIFFSIVLYVIIGYVLERHENLYLLSSYTILFVCYLSIIRYGARQSTGKLLLISIFFRLILLLSLPILSDDIYRFFWDGKLLTNGINPFQSLPSELIVTDKLPEGLSFNLYQLLNSPNYYTIYPPVAQAIFWLAASLSDNIISAAVCIRMVILFAELGTFYFIIKLLRHYKLPEHNVLYYALNPLVILELTGNLHFEAFMIFFLTGAIYFLIKNRRYIAILFWSLSIAAKLIPIIFLPLLIGRIKIKKLLIGYGLLAVITVVWFTPLLDESLIFGMQESIGLYFQKFEFNASIYYLVREVGYWAKGYNMIQTLGPWLALLTFMSILILSVFSKKIKLLESMLWALTIYFMMATTVHPWYITTLLILSLFTNYRFPILWSFLIFMTYVGYGTSGYVENYWVVSIEYCLVTLYIFYEIFFKKNGSKLESHTL